MSDRLGTAQWQSQAVVSQRYPFSKGKFWLGRAEDDTAIGYSDDRHICVVSGTRGGKGTSLIVNNLCFWPGSAVVIDPKGENATVTAARRGQGSEHCVGMGQDVHVLDPFKTAHVDERYRSSFNPLDELDPADDETIDKAIRLANALVVVNEKSPDPVWDESARTMLQGIILHVLTSASFLDEERNLVTVRKLILRGEWRVEEALRDEGHAEIDDPHMLLWKAMKINPAFDGKIAGIGSEFRFMMASSTKTYLGVFRSISQHTEFLDSPPMRRILEKSDFRLADLKTRPQGVTLYLSLPQDYMETHYRWLRMMVTLTTSAMQSVRGKPATGYPVLMVLDEFAGLKRMASIENAVAQIAGFGVKLLFVLQSLEQLQAVYDKNWETFLSNAGVKVFFSVEDHFTREYVSKLAGETEITRNLHSSNESQSENESYAESRSHGETLSKSTTRGTSKSATKGASFSRAAGVSRSANQSRTDGVNQSRSSTDTFGTNETLGWSSGTSNNLGELSFGMNSSSSSSRGNSRSASRGVSEGTSASVSRGLTDGTNRSDTRGTSNSHTIGTSESETVSRSETNSVSYTTTQGTSRTKGTGTNETIHRRPLIQPDEVGRFFTRIDDESQPQYPGFALVMMTGADPMAVRRTHYFEDVQFIDCFSPHPDHKFRPAVARRFQASYARPLIEELEAAMNGKRLTISQWLVQPGTVTDPNQVVARIERVPPDNRTVCLRVPYYGKVSETAETSANRLATGEYAIPGQTFFEIKSYQDSLADDQGAAFNELLNACIALRKLPKPKPLKQKKDDLGPVGKAVWAVSFGTALVFAVLLFIVLIGEVVSLFHDGEFLNPYMHFGQIVDMTGCVALVISVFAVWETSKKNWRRYLGFNIILWLVLALLLVVRIETAALWQHRQFIDPLQNPTIFWEAYGVVAFCMILAPLWDFTYERRRRRKQR